MAHILEVTDQSFTEEVMGSDLPVLVDLFATWCPPCKAMGEVLDKLAPQLAGRVKMVKVNIDTAPKLVAAFKVSGVPTLVLMDKGRIVDGYVGMVAAKAILQMIDKVSPPRLTAKACR